MLISRQAGRAERLVPLNPAYLSYPGRVKLLLMKNLRKGGWWILDKRGLSSEQLEELNRAALIAEDENRIIEEKIRQSFRRARRVFR